MDYKAKLNGKQNWEMKLGKMIEKCPILIDRNLKQS